MNRRCINGLDLRKARKAANLTQADLAERAEIGRHAVSYWECRAIVPLRGWAVQRIIKALCMPPVPYIYPLYARAGAWGESLHREMEARIETQLAALR